MRMDLAVRKVKAPLPHSFLWQWDSDHLRLVEESQSQPALMLGCC